MHAETDALVTAERLLAKLLREPLGPLEACCDPLYLERVSAALAQCTSKPAQLCVDSDSKGTTDARWGLRVRRGNWGEAWITLDAAACRAIVDALASKHGGLRGSGELSRAELGVLEFAALECAESLGVAGVTIEAFASGAELQRLATAAVGASATLELILGARRGRVVVRSTRALEKKPFRAGAGEAGELTIGLVLAPIELAAAELATLAPGDVVLLGVTDLTALGVQARLATSSGWELSTAVVERDSASGIDVRAGALAPGVLAIPSERAVLPWLGEARLCPLELSRWRADQALALSKPSAKPARLCRADGRVHAAELVRASGELALRLLT